MKPIKATSKTSNAGKGFRALAVLLILGSAHLIFAAPGPRGFNSAHPKFSRDLDYAHGGSNHMVDVIVQYRVTPNSTHYSRMASRGAFVKARLHGIRAAAFRVPASAIPLLEKDPDVLYVSPDRPLQLHSFSQFEPYDSAVMADAAAQQYGLDGTGIGIAVIDSGVTDHPDLHNSAGQSRVVYSQSFVNGDPTTADGYGHGTHVSGIAAGNGAASAPGSGYPVQFTGLAPNANIINLRVLDKNGNGSDSQVIAAIQAAIQLKNQYNIRIINLSLGRPVYESYTLDPLCQAVEQAWQAGIVVVVAAGNSGRDNSQRTSGFATIDAPGNDPYVITVGATRTFNSATRVDDAIASYSSKGPTLLDHIVKPDVVAPGNRIVSLLVSGSSLDANDRMLEVAPDACTTGSCSSRYFRLSGTSMSTPVVSGAVALMLQQNPGLTPDTVKARLMKTAWKGFGTFCSSYDVFLNLYNNQYDIFTYGAGYMDVDQALASNDVAAGPALSPSVSYNATNRTISIQNTGSSNLANSVIWGQSVVWGASAVWGGSVISANSVVWGDSVIWGQSVVWGNGASAGFGTIWGQSVVWGSSNMTSAYSDGQDGEN
ncbi:MAG TPA: S8 family serine peptidase [Terriglobales bacterium]|nr:S8 family serine peptidase [Terriglobales bacterium]